MSEKHNIRYIQKRERFIKQFASLKEAKDLSQRNQYIQQLVLRFEERLDDLKERIDTIPELLSHEGKPISEKKQIKLDEKKQKNNEYPPSVKNLHKGYSAVFALIVGFFGYVGIGSLLGGLNSALWAPGLVGLALGVGAIAAIPTFVYAFKQIKNGFNKDTIQKKKFSLSRILYNRFLKREKENTNQISKKHVLNNTVRLTIDTRIDDLLNGKNRFIHNGQIREEFDFLSKKDKAELLDTTSYITECRKELDEIVSTLQRIKNADRTVERTTQRSTTTTVRQSQQPVQGFAKPAIRTVAPNVRKNSTISVGAVPAPARRRIRTAETPAPRKRTHRSNGSKTNR